MIQGLEARVEHLWYGRQAPARALLPLSRLFGTIARRRRKHYQNPGKQYRSPLPVVVIGNLTVGGTGKSPLTAWLVNLLQGQGYQPVILSRGYGGRSDRFPLLVTGSTRADDAGDEPLMLARQCRVPVVVDPDRARSARWAAEEGLGNILICDDGLQHYRLARDLELVVFDGSRGAGNGALLPAGPLREPLARLSAVTAVVVNGAPRHGTFAAIREEAPALLEMTLEPQAMRNLASGKLAGADHFQGRTVHAVAGIGNPGRFFATLEGLGCQVLEHAFPDHHGFSVGDFPDDNVPVVMTAKDSVKCESFARDDWWVLEVAASPDPELGRRVIEALG